MCKSLTYYDLWIKKGIKHGSKVSIFAVDRYLRNIAAPRKLI